MVMLMGLNSLFLLLNLAAVTHNSLGEEVPHKFSRDDFPPGFIFGAGTSAYQVEGAAAEDGRKPSIWDVFTHAGKMPNKSTGDVAADQYHKYKGNFSRDWVKFKGSFLMEDVKLAHDIGLDAYRFSISWSRLLPDGRGAVNPKGLMYYNNLINELINHGIQPHVTLQHLDPPQALEDEYKGWLSPRIIDDFKGYAEVCFREFGDRVRHWSTINEPNMFPLGSYDLGFWPPQRCSNPFGLINCTVGNSSTEPYIVTHNELLAHAAAARLYKDKYQATQGGSIGISIYCFWYVPYTNSSSDVAATQRALDFNSGWILRPLVSGDYPETMKEMVGSRLPSFTKEESEVVKASFDYIGLVHYTTMYVSDDQSRRKTGLRDYQADVSVKFSVEKDGVPINELPGATPVVPWGLQGILEYIKQTYNNPPIFIHENGYGSRNQESMPLSKALNDTSRVSYLDGYLRSLLNAIRDGSNTKGYFVWSLLDCFEVLNGYESRFGLYHVDFKDQDLRRYPKLSAHWYSNFLKSNPNNKHLESTSFAKYHSTV